MNFILNNNTNTNLNEITVTENTINLLPEGDLRKNQSKPTTNNFIQSLKGEQMMSKTPIYPSRVTPVSLDASDIKIIKDLLYRKEIKDTVNSNSNNFMKEVPVNDNFNLKPNKSPSEIESDNIHKALEKISSSLHNDRFISSTKNDDLTSEKPITGDNLFLTSSPSKFYTWRYTTIPSITNTLRSPTKSLPTTKPIEKINDHQVIKDQARPSIFLSFYSDDSGNNVYSKNITNNYSNKGMLLIKSDHSKLNEKHYYFDQNNMYRR